MKNFYDLVTVVDAKGNIAEDIYKTITKYASGMPIIINFDDEEGNAVLIFETDGVKIPVENIDACEDKLAIRDNKGTIFIFKETSEDDLISVVLEKTGLAELKDLLPIFGLSNIKNATKDEIILLNIINYVMSH